MFLRVTTHKDSAWVNLLAWPIGFTLAAIGMSIVCVAWVCNLVLGTKHFEYELSEQDRKGEAR